MYKKKQMVRNLCKILRLDKNVVDLLNGMKDDYIVMEALLKKLIIL